MTLRPEYGLGHSPYNPFLFAAVGEERNGATLTVQSALTRLGYDPWREAARLSGLPRDTAAGALAVSIAMLPEGDWNASDSEAIATRLVTWLPAGAAAPVPAVEAGRSEGKQVKTIERIERTERIGKMKREFTAAVAWSVLAAALLFFAMNFFSSNNLETGQSDEAAGVSTQQ